MKKKKFPLLLYILGFLQVFLLIIVNDSIYQGVVNIDSVLYSLVLIALICHFTIDKKIKPESKKKLDTLIVGLGIPLLFLLVAPRYTYKDAEKIIQAYHHQPFILVADMPTTIPVVSGKIQAKYRLSGEFYYFALLFEDDSIKEYIIHPLKGEVKELQFFY